MRNKTTSESGSYWLQWALMALLLLLVIGCTEERANLQLTGTVKGLKQGVIYLERWENDSITVMDSTVILGEPNFRMDVYIEEPEVLYLKLTDEGIDEPNIVFFAEPGEMDIQTSLKRFTYDAKISGSGRQKTLDSFNLLVKRFNDRNLDLIKSQLEAQQSGDTVQLAAINSEMERLVRLRYLTAINFALNHSSSEVAPYIALTEVFDANVKYLDTIYNALSDQVIKSKYGRTLRSFIDERKKTMDSLN